MQSSFKNIFALICITTFTTSLLSMDVIDDTTQLTNSKSDPKIESILPLIPLSKKRDHAVNKDYKKTQLHIPIKSWMAIPKELKKIIFSFVKKYLKTSSTRQNHNFSFFQFNHDGTRAITMLPDNSKHEVKIWDFKTRKALHVLPHDSYLFNAALNNDDTLIATESFGTIKLWDGSTGDFMGKLEDPVLQNSAASKGHTHGVVSLEFNHNGSQIISASRDGSAKIWNTSTRALDCTIPNISNLGVTTLNCDSSLIGLTRINGPAQIWNVTTKARLHLLSHANHTSSIKFSPDDSKIITTGNNNTAKIWDTITGICLHTLDTGADFNCGEFSPDSKQVLTASTRTAKVWDVETGTCVDTLYVNPIPAHAPGYHNFKSANFSRNGKKILIKNKDGSLNVWELPEHFIERLVDGQQGLPEPVATLKASKLTA